MCKLLCVYCFQLLVASYIANTYLSHTEVSFSEYKKFNLHNTHPWGSKSAYYDMY